MWLAYGDSGDCQGLLPGFGARAFVLFCFLKEDFLKNSCRALYITFRCVPWEAGDLKVQ